MAEKRTQAQNTGNGSEEQKKRVEPLRKRSKSLAEQVMDDLARRIGEGELRSGEKLPTEAQLMQEQGVSRTVVREAISRMQASGMVETRHGIGTFVLDPEQPSGGLGVSPSAIVTIRDIIAMMELRISLETEAAGLAALRRSAENLANMRAAVDLFAKQVIKGDAAVQADMQFHLEIALATGNRYFEEIYRYLGVTTIPRTRINTTRFSLESGEPYLITTNREHEDILSAIDRRDPESARAAMRMHLSNSKERLRRVAEQAEGMAGSRA